MEGRREEPLKGSSGVFCSFLQARVVTLGDVKKTDCSIVLCVVNVMCCDVDARDVCVIRESL